MAMLSPLASVPEISSNLQIRTMDVFLPKQLRILVGTLGLLAGLAGANLLSAVQDVEPARSPVESPPPDLPENAIWRFGQAPDANGIYRLAYSPNGKLLATRNRDNIVTIYDVAARTRLCDVGGYDNNWVYCIDFSPDSQYFMTAAGSGEKLKIWTAQTGKLISEIETDALAAYFSKSGEAIHVLGDSHVETYSWPGVQLISQTKWKTGPETRMAMSRDGRLVVTFRTINRQIHRTQVVDLETKSKVQLDGSTGNPRFVAISKNRNWVAASYDRDEKIRLWDLSDPHRKKFTLIKHDETVQSLSFSADNRFLLSSSWDEKVVVWDLLTRQAIAELLGHSEHVNATAFSPSELTVASGASGPSDTTTIVWDLKEFLLRPTDQPIDFEQIWSDLGANALDASLDATAQFMAGGDPFLDQLENRMGAILAEKTGGSIDETIKLLDHPRWEIRENATLHLLSIRAKADAEIRLALDEADSPEIRSRLSRVLRKKFERPKINVVDHRRWSRIVFALEQINSPRANGLLESLANGSRDIEIGLDAKSAFRRNQQRSAIQ